MRKGDKPKSQRNRHTGRINAYKKRILEKGESFMTSDGRIYKATLIKKAMTMINDAGEPEVIPYVVSQIVRA